MGNTVKVEGVLKYNIDTRNEHIRRNAGKYSQYMMELAPAIGEVYNIKSRAVHSLTNSESLLDYTHGENSSYSDVIDNLYFKNVEDKEVYSVNSEIDERQERWRGSYNDYLDYISKVYGDAPVVSTLKAPLHFTFDMQDSAYVDLPRNLASAIDSVITPMLNTSVSVGYIHFNKPYEAIKGTAIVTNPNKPDSDTNLGIIGNRIYAMYMQRGANYGDARGTQFKYLTPMLHFEYGLNNDTLPTLGNNLGVLDEIGRMPDLGAAHDAYIQQFSEGSSATNGGRVYLEQLLLMSNFYSPHPLKHYIDFSGINNGLGVVSNIAEFSMSTKRAPYATHHRISDSFWNEGDVIGRTPTNNDLISGNTVSIHEIAPTSNKSLLTKTRELFNNHTIKTMVGRFHTSSDTPNNSRVEITDTAKTGYGNSHGRNLLKYNHVNSKTNEYSDPYCRVWTYHKQYDRVNRLIRPFEEFSERDLQKFNTKARSHYGEGVNLQGGDGGEYLSDNTVLNNTTGIVNIAPSKSGKVDIKKCMFSIENLAWKDVSQMDCNLSKEQRGPNGGRIMWFPPYDLDFQESVNVNWQSNEFIGRGEKIYSYANTDRTGTLSFSLLIDHPSIIDTYDDERFDEDDDLLRFFAGCRPLAPSMKSMDRIVSIEDVVIGKNGQDKGTITDKPNGEEPLDMNKIVFYVFFPNNYSGNSGVPQLYNDIDVTNKPIDPDWVEYLMTGKNVTTPAESRPNEYVGYEMGEAGINGISVIPTSGVSVSVEDAVKHGGLPDYISVCSTGNCMHNSDETEIKSIPSPATESELKNNGYKNISHRKYCYRVDYDLRQAGLHVQLTKPILENYEDQASYELNCNVANVRKKFKDATCAFSDIVFYSDNARSSTNLSLHVKNFYDENMLSEKGPNPFYDSLEMIKIKKVTIQGNASEHDKENAKALGLRRGNSVSDFLKNKFNGKFEWPSEISTATWDVKTSSIIDVDAGDKKNSNAFSAKAGRMVRVEMEIEPNNTLNASLVFGEAKRPKPIKHRITTTIENSRPIRRRYETESEYFEKIGREDTFVNEYSRSLKDKFKYFDPAFHAISPEGFNARLTFLQQCTRQGHTIEAKQEGSNIQAAGNLAFGRMPVCILRIGDFLYNRVLIQSMSINYGSSGVMQWDLNPEGAGVQPMYAKISLGIVILGGASLEGPINRLQNAVSFNYYANTPVYDDRADRSRIKEGKDDYYHLYTPNESYDGMDYSIKTHTVTETEYEDDTKGILWDMEQEVNKTIEEILVESSAEVEKDIANLINIENDSLKGEKTLRPKVMEDKDK